VGISVDTAVDVAKESADIILLEKSLMVLEEGVIQGRVVFGNIVNCACAPPDRCHHGKSELLFPSLISERA
jgi:hypothetical protein